jgi:hypothetical protein
MCPKSRRNGIDIFVQGTIYDEKSETVSLDPFTSIRWAISLITFVFLLRHMICTFGFNIFFLVHIDSKTICDSAENT